MKWTFQIKEFNLTEDEAVEFMLEAVNIANAVSFLIPINQHSNCLDAGSRFKCTSVSCVQ
jgi:hypothetical protein